MVQATGRNATFRWAWQSAFGIAADTAATSLEFNTVLGSAGLIGVQGPEQTRLMGKDGDAVDPELGPHDVSGSWQLPLCARQSGLWFRALCGEAGSTTTVGSRGGFLFKALPVANDTITIGSTTFTFVAGAPSGNQIQIGTTILETVDNAKTAIDGETNITTTDHGQILLVEHDTADATGDTVATTSSATNRVQAFSATLQGGGNTKHVWQDDDNTGRPFVSVETLHGDISSGNFKSRLVDSMMVTGISIPKNRSGRAQMTANAVARRDNRSSAAQLADPSGANILTAAPFSYLGGSILIDGKCIGTIDSAGVSCGFEVTADGYDACSAGDEAYIGEPVLGDTTASVELTARFPVNDLHDAAIANTPVAAKMFYLNKATGAVLIIDIPRVFLSRPTEQYNGVGSITASFTGVGYRDTTAGHRFQITLYGPVADYTPA